VLHRQVGARRFGAVQGTRAHFGDGSPLMKYLGRDQADGFLSCLQGVLSEQLTSQREQVLKQFSMDNKEGGHCTGLSRTYRAARQDRRRHQWSIR